MWSDLKARLLGLVVPIVTPMHEDYRLNLDIVPSHIDYLLANGVNVIIPCGSTGEFPSLTDEERKEMVDATVKAVNERVPVIVGASDTRVSSILEQARFAKEVGADGVMITPPYYFLPTEEDVLAFFKYIDERIEIPFMFYNNPATTKFNASISLLERISTLDHFVAIKENNSQPVRYYEELERFGELFPVIPAGEPPAIFNILSGAPGFLSVAANFNPRLIMDMLRAAQENRIQDAFAYTLFEKLRTYRQIFEDRNRKGYPMYVVFAKAALNLIGYQVGPPRPPLRPPTPDEINQVRKVLQDVMGLEVV